MEITKPKTLECIVKKPVMLKVGEFANDSTKSGVLVIDILFPGASSVEVGELTFKNCYTASITIRMKVLDQVGSEVWKTAVKNFPLMPHPHFETGSQDFFTLLSDKMNEPLSQVVMVRLILRQPSSHWTEFGVEEIKLFPPPSTSSTSAPVWLSVDGQMAVKSGQNCPNSECVASSIQELWAAVEELKSSKQNATIGRFDVDGSYDINLLSYT